MATEILQIVLSKKERKSRLDNRLCIPVQYSEKSLLCHLNLPDDVTVATVKDQPASTMIGCLEDNYNIVLKNYKVVVSPVPQSSDQKWIDLGEDAMVMLLPLENDMTPLKKKYDKIEQQVKDKDSHLERDAYEQKIDKIMSEQKEQKEKLELRLREQDKKIAHTDGVVLEQSQELRKAIMDDLRKVIVDGLGEHSWHQIEQGSREETVKDEIEKLKTKSQLTLSSSALDMALLLVDDHSKRGNDGNTATHTGTYEDISAAILSLHQDKERNLFIDCYKLAYNQEPVL
ncbi:hypothetical protein Clacol_000803 [Clathrus columnatus]|uniref:Uncharacterized protein n=1 Tax=Clathrus columnatus TaxID=1419009 RepID=A0AAV5A3Y3_9AGAM|nr:hypothetical protein Clacol_000803 [Clathrus columnatus]